MDAEKNDELQIKIKIHRSTIDDVPQILKLISEEAEFLKMRYGPYDIIDLM